jgi:3-oxoacyl-[acyl-carrier protein] reductase
MAIPRISVDKARGYPQARALVTGGASGIGFATACQLAQLGARVAVNHLPDDAAGAQRIRELAATGLEVFAAAGDVSDPASAPAMVADAVDQLGGLDYLVNSAGTPAVSRRIPPDELDALTDPVWERILSTNLLGPFRVTRAASSALRASEGAVVNVASAAGLRVTGSTSAYAASKAGLIRLTVDLARGLAPVRVNAVAPALVATPWTADWPEETKRDFVAQTLLGRICEPEDVADVIVFLLRGTQQMTGQTLVVDGGFSL